MSMVIKMNYPKCIICASLYDTRQHDDVIKWKHFPRYWPFVQGIHRWIPHTRPVTRIFDVFFDLRLNKRFSKQSWGWWLETPSCPLWRHSNDKNRFPYGNILSCIIMHALRVSLVKTKHTEAWLITLRFLRNDRHLENDIFQRILLKEHYRNLKGYHCILFLVFWLTIKQYGSR